MFRLIGLYMQKRTEEGRSRTKSPIEYFLFLLLPTMIYGQLTSAEQQQEKTGDDLMVFNQIVALMCL